jgi:hypothetical protein
MNTFWTWHDVSDKMKKKLGLPKGYGFYIGFLLGLGYYRFSIKEQCTTYRVSFFWLFFSFHNDESVWYDVSCIRLIRCFLHDWHDISCIRLIRCFLYQTDTMFLVSDWYDVSCIRLIRCFFYQTDTMFLASDWNHYFSNSQLFQ